MNDIDYDELDRAVSSLTGNTAVDSAAAPSAPVADNNVIVQQATPTAQVSTTANIQASLTEKRSSGRFMDVMHPSSDMRTPQVPPRPVENNSPAQLVPPPQPIAPPSPPPMVPTMPTATGSPFLPDTKVEKRPLGAFADSGPNPEMNTSSDKPTGNDTPMPPELQDDLLSLESNEDTVAEPEATTPPEEPQQPTVASPQVPGSIFQQYTEKAETPAPATASIFEVGSIKPVKQKSGKKAGWMVIVWILLLIILGAGAGAAVYFYVLPLIQP